MVPIDVRSAAGGIGLGMGFSSHPIIVAAGFRQLGKDIKSVKEPLKRSIQQVMAPSFQKNFDVGGRPAWEPLHPATIAAKGHSKPLVRSGTLRSVAGQLNIWTIQGQQGRAFVSRLPDRAWYGAIHQEGSERTPTRPFLVVQEEDGRKIDNVFDKWLRERVAARL
jgi:phage gpG-like protein